MNRERAETYLRLLAEAGLRDAARAGASRTLDIPHSFLPVTLIRAAWALTTVGVLEPDTAQAILADAELARAGWPRCARTCGSTTTVSPRSPRPTCPNRG